MRQDSKQANRIVEQDFVRYNSAEYHSLKAKGWVETYRGPAPLIGITEFWSQMVYIEPVR